MGDDGVPSNKGGTPELPFLRGDGGGKRTRRDARKQVAVVHHGLRPSLCGALVLVAIVATAMMAMMVMVITPAAATATQEVVLPM